MRELAELLDYVNLALYTAVAVIALWQWRGGRGQAALWTALAFGSLAFVVDLGNIIEAALDEDSGLQEALTRVIIAGLALFPYFLYRFTTAFRPPPARLERSLALMTVIVVVWTFLLPSIPDEGEPQPGFFTAFVIAFMVHWTVLTIVVAWRLWSAGRGMPGVGRRRMRTFAFAATAITVALTVSAFAPDDAAESAAAAGALAAVSALAFLLALAPPSWLRSAWRRAEQEQLQQTIAELMTATTESEVLERVLPPMASMVGAAGAELRAPDGSILGVHGVPEGERVDVALPSGGAVVVHTSAYAPYFGSDELRALRTIGSLTELALDRSRLFSQERQAREVLEQADELKTNFIALAAHELRNPVTVVHGLADTLERLGPQLTEEQRVEMRRALREQTDRLRLLIEQLLDLSRLDADAVAIAPERLRIRERIDTIVDFAAAGRRGEVEVDVPDDLEATIDPEVLDRVVSNLVVNALRYGESPVRVRAEQRDRHFRVTVEDSGPGVAPEFVPDLFERFTRSTSTQATAGGTGLGLAIARSYARAHRGDLLYETAHPMGACFELVIPTNGNP